MNLLFQHFSTLGVHCNDYPQWKKNKEEERKVSECITAMQAGSQLKKWRRPVSPPFYYIHDLQSEKLLLSEDCHKIYSYSLMGRKKTMVLVDDIKEVHLGLHTETSRSVSMGIADCCFSVIFGDNCKSLELLASSPAEAKIWVDGLSSFVRNNRRMSECITTMQAGIRLKEFRRTVPYLFHYIQDLQISLSEDHREIYSYSLMGRKKTMVSECITTMQAGSQLKEFGQTVPYLFHSIHDLQISLSEDHREIYSYSLLGRKKTMVLVDDIKEVHLGLHTETSRSSFRGNADHCFSVIFGDNCKSLELLASSPAEAKIWVYGLSSLVRKRGAEIDTNLVKDICASYLPNLKLDVEEDVIERQSGDILTKAHVNIKREYCCCFICSHGVQEKNVIENGKILKSVSSVFEDIFTVTLDEIKKKKLSNANFLEGIIFRTRVCGGKDIGKGVPDRADCSGGGQAQNLNESSQLSWPEYANFLEAYATSPAFKPNEDLKANISLMLENDHCIMLASYFELSPAEANKKIIQTDEAPGTILMKILDEREKIMSGKMIGLFQGLKACHLDKIARMHEYSKENSKETQQERNQQQERRVKGISEDASVSQRPSQKRQTCCSLSDKSTIHLSAQTPLEWIKDHHDQTTKELAENKQQRKRPSSSKTTGPPKKQEKTPISSTSIKDKTTKKEPAENKQQRKRPSLSVKKTATPKIQKKSPAASKLVTSAKRKGWKGTWLSGRPNLLACLLVHFVLLPSACGTVICPENQTAELGGQGYISCNFPNDFYEVYWSDDDASDSSSPVITFKPNEEVKSGPGFESGAYDVHQNGTLIITNVTKWHEGVYKVIVYTRSSISHGTFFISLKVTASPGNQFPIVLCHNCHGEYYYSLKDKETPSCSFSAARPPVQLEWFEYFDDEYNPVEIQQFNSTENRNGTYNSLATLHSLKDSSNMIHSLLCRATWPLSDWRREKEILVESTSNMSFSDVTPKTQYVVVNTYAVIVCGGSSSAYVVWKRILTNSEPEIIGFHSHAMTETISSFPDVEVSAEGNLIFSSPQVHHEGNYACIYGDGQKEEIQMTSVELLIPPSPPYIQITGCDDVSHSCVVKEDSTKKLTCAVYGFRPTASLEWIAEDEDEISFFNHKEVIKESSETTDITLSVEYKVSQNVLCGEEILIGCHLYGPLSKIMKAESTALISPASCKEHGETGEHGLEGFVIALIVTGTLILVNVISIIYLCYCYRTKSATAMRAYNSVAAIYDLQDSGSVCTGNGKPTGNKPNGSTVHHVEDEQML